METKGFSQPSNRSSLDALLHPPRMWSRSEVLSLDCVPRVAGVYGWYFQQVPPSVPVDGCLVNQGRTLLYGGIAPKEPPTNGRPASSQTLWHRIRYHMRGNAYGSTLRLTLGCLLADELGIQLRRVGGGKRMTFADGENKLSSWMNENAYVCWLETEKPWIDEAQFIASTCLPLNLDQNRSHAFHATLTALRRAARQRANALPVWRTN